MVPQPRPCDIIVMDNLSSYERPDIHAMIENAGAKLSFLAPYSADFKPINRDFAKLNAPLRKAAERPVEGRRDAIGRFGNLITPQECANNVRNFGGR